MWRIAAGNSNHAFPRSLEPMAHLIEPAASGRSRCRGCGTAIRKGELRFGECLDNPYGEGDMTLWFHPRCAAYRRPESFLEALAAHEDPELAPLRAAADFSLAHRRVRRIGSIERAATGRARCRSCRGAIARDGLRIPLLFYEEGMFTASGFVHLECAPGYFESTQLLDCIRHFNPGLDGDDLREIQRLLT
jgi:hypothetical protein